MIVHGYDICLQAFTGLLSEKAPAGSGWQNASMTDIAQALGADGAQSLLDAVLR